MKKIFSLISCLCYFSLVVDCSATVSNTTNTVSEIIFEGLDKVEPAAIADCLTINPNQKFTNDDIDRTLKNLFKKDFFSYISFLRKNDVLIIKCVEKPMVDKIAFEGNDAVSGDILKNVANNSRIGEGRLFSKHVIKDIVADLQTAYKAMGFHSAIIVPKQIQHPGNKVDVVFEIKEGEKTTTKKLLFVGNKTFSDDTLKELLSTKEEKIWRFWDYESHVFREDRIDVDIETITSFYKNRGYPFFMIVSTSSELDFNKQSNYCTFIMEEGDKYTIKNIELTSEIQKIKAEDFQDLLKIEKDSDFNEALIKANRDLIRRSIALKDNPFIDVTIDISYDKINKTASIKFSIIERPKAFIERIEITGNAKTLDNVIRREFSVHEGDALNTYKIQNTIERLKGLDFFDDVQIAEEPGSTDDKKVLVVSVKEKESTSHINFGLTVNDSDGFGGFVGFVEDNLMGTGKMLSTEINWMQKLYGGKISLYDPRFLDQNFGAGLSIGGNCYDRKKVDHSVTKSAYLSPFIRYNIRDNLSHRIAYTISFSNRRWWSDKDGKAYSTIPDSEQKNQHVLMKDEYGKFTCGELSSTLFYTQTDNPYDPRNGYDISLMNSYAGIGGKVRFFKNELEMNYYHALNEKLTFITNATIGCIKEIRDTRSVHRYTLGGGDCMRGFDPYGIGTRDIHNNSVGGNKYWTLSFMLKAPLSTREVGINGVVFLDFGSAWGTKYDITLVKDSKAVRASAGVAIEWAHSPFGMPLSFVFGFPIKKCKFDEKQTFTLNGLM